MRGQSRQGSGYGIRKKAKQERGAFAMVLWGTLGVLAYQAIQSSHAWALPWVVLGVAALLVKRIVQLHVVLAVEMPIFWMIVGYSATTIFLEADSAALDFLNDLSLNTAMWLAWGGTALFLVGMTVALRWHVGERKSAVVRVTERQGVTIYLVGLFCSQVLQRIAPPSIWVIAYMFGQCVPIGLFILLKHYVDSPRTWVGTQKFYLWLAAFSWWAIYSVLGGIFGATLVVMLLMFGPYLERSRVFVVTAVILGLAFAPLFQEVKGDFRQRVADKGVAEQRQLWEVLSENCQRCFLEGDPEAYRKGIAALADRLCIFDMWIRVKKHMDTNHDYAGGKTVVDALLTSFIPRFLWPSKPITGGSNELAANYADMVIAEGTSVGVGVISEFAINGGDPGVLFGMLGLGLVGGFTLSLGWRDRVKPLGMIMGILTFANLVRPESNLSDVLGGLVRYVVVWLAIRHWILREYRRRMLYQDPRAHEGEPSS